MNNTQNERNVDQLPGNPRDREMGRDGEPLGDRGDGNRTWAPPPGEQGISNRANDEGGQEPNASSRAIAGDHGSEQAADAADVDEDDADDDDEDADDDADEDDGLDAVADADQDDDNVVADQLAPEDPDPLVPRGGQNRTQR
jgi:hypothetical protein